MKEINCRGMACPQPVVTTKQALEQFKDHDLIVIVDNPSSSENVKRFAQSQGCAVKLERRGEDFYVHIQKGEGKDEDKVAGDEGKDGKLVVYINSDLLGGGDEALGSFLMKAFLKTLLDLKKIPHRLILINSGVRLASEGSQALDTLRTCSEKGVEIVSCGTCLDFYKLRDKLGVGRVSNMFDILQSMVEADCVIRP
jgi:tRNA 2-thiouridine synthesizing protein A